MIDFKIGSDSSHVLWTFNGRLKGFELKILLLQSNKPLEHFKENNSLLNTLPLNKKTFDNQFFIFISKVYYKTLKIYKTI